MAGFNLTAQLNLRGPNNVKQIVSDIKSQLGKITGNVDLKVNTTTTKDVTSLNAALKQLNSNLAQTQASAAGAANAISLFATSTKSVNKNISSTSSQINSTTNATNKLSQAQKSITKTLSESTTTMQEFGKQSSLAVRRFAAYSAATGTILGLTNAIRFGITSFISYEKEFVKVQQVTDKTASQLSGLNSEITRLSTGFGVASADLIAVSATLAQAGLSATETQKALQALALADLAPSFDNLNSTVEGSIALMRQFGIGARELEKALGSVNAVSSSFAVESSDLIAAIQRTGGVFAAASKGVSEGTDALNEFLAVFTSVRQTTRESAETIATGLRTIFTRIQREDTIQALREYGVSLTDVEGKFVGAYKAVELLSRGLSTLDPRDIRFSNIVEELGGFRQIGKVIPLIQQFSVAQQALSVAQQGQGSLAQDAIVAQQSLANQLSKVREEFLALMRSVGSSDAFQTITKSALGFTSVIIKVADAVKGVLPVLAILGARQLASGIGQYATGFVGGLSKQTDQSGGAGRSPGSGSQPIRPTFPVVGGGSSGNSSTRDLSLLDDILKQNVQATNSLAGDFNVLATSMNSLNTNINGLNTSLNDISLALATIDQYSQSLHSNTAGLNSLEASVVSLTSAIRDIEMGGGGATLNKGGKVLGFARGGVVPGVGNTDSVPAMLQPGEFVIRKKAVETIGSQNLHDMNKYGLGGSVISGSSGQQRQMFAKGGPILVKTAANAPGGRGTNGIASYYNNKIQERDKIFGNIDRKTIGKQQVDDFYQKTQKTKSGSTTEQQFAEDIRTASQLKSREPSSDTRYSKPFRFAKGFAFEDFMGEYLKQVEGKDGYTKSLGQFDPIDFVGGGDPIEVRFRDEKTSNATILAKKLRYSFEQGHSLGFTPEIDDKPGVDIGSTILYEVDPVYKKTLGLKSGGKIQTFLDGGWVKRMQQQKKSTLSSAATQLEYWIDKIYAGTEDVGYSPTFQTGKLTSEKVDFQELQDRFGSISNFLTAPASQAKAKRNGLKSAGGYEPEEILDAIKLYQGGSGPLTRAMANNDLLFVDRDEQYDTEEVTNRLQAAAQYKTRKKLYSGLGKSQFKETLKDTGLSEDDISDQNKVKAMVGKTIDFPTFLSTSYQRDVASAFVGDPGAMMEISTAKSKTSGIDINKAKMTADIGKKTSRRLPGIDKISEEKLFKYDDEDEFILPPNTAFKVKKASTNKIRATSDSGEEFDLVMGMGGAANDGKTSLIDLAVQMLGAGGRTKPQKFAIGGEAQSVADKFGLGKPLTADSWWTGDFAGQEILFDWSAPTKAYKTSDGSRIDIEQNLRQPLMNRSQREWRAFTDQQTKARDADKKPLTPEEIANLRQYDLSDEQRAKISASAQAKKAQAYVDKTSGLRRDVEDYGQRRKRTPEEYLKRARGYTAGGIAETEDTLPSSLQQLLDRISVLGGPKTATELAGYTSGSMNIRKLLNKNSLLAGKDVPKAEAIVAQAEEAYKKRQASQKSAIDTANQFALVGAYPLGYSKDFGPEDISGRPTFFTARGLPSSYQQVIDQMSSKVKDLPSDAAELVQMQNIFGSVPLAFDLDDTLITGADIFKPGSSADPDIPAYSNVKKVTEALQGAKLTRLGEVLKSKLTETPELLENIRILTARPQNNAEAISARLSQLGVPISSSKITGVSGASNKVKNLSEFETLVDDRLATIEQVTKSGKKAIGYEPIKGYDPSSASGKKASEVMEGYVIEGLMERLGVPIVEDGANRAIDFPNGLGSLASIWGVKPNVPTDAKRTMDGDAFGRFRGEIERYYAENVQAFAIGGRAGTNQQKTKQDSMLEKYKKVLSRILPEQMLSEEGLFKGTTSKDINISQTRNFVDWARYLLGRPGASHTSDDRSFVSQALLDVKGQIDPSDYSDLEAELSYEMGQKQRSSRIFIPRGSRKADSALAHETVHDIQHNLRKHYPDIYTKLIESAVARKSQIVELIDKNKDKVGYSSASIFGVDESKLAYSGTGSSIMGEMVGIKTNEKLSSPQQILANKIDGYYRNDEILAMLMELESVGVSEASSILSDILQSSGLKTKKFADGGKALGLDDMGMSGLISTMYGAPDSIARNFQGAGLIAGMSERSIGAAGATGLQKSEQKKPKNYGKIALSEDGGSIRAGYFKNEERSGYAQAQKFKDNLYYVGLSKATSGYGPKLYDVLMEAVTEKGAMLTSDRSSVSGDAKGVWEYYFNNRPDVQKTPLDPENWTKNSALVDPKLYGKEETWPPFNDPVWILQTGYSKSPSTINDPEVVQRNVKQNQSSQSMALDYFSGQRFATGGSVEDTVPALLTPGEFVINKKAAQKIGYSKLEQLNKADKIQGFNKGGLVQYFKTGGKAAPGDYEAGVQKFRMQLEILGKAAKDATYAFERNKGSNPLDAKNMANVAEIGAILKESMNLLKTATGDMAQQIRDAARTLEEDRRSATSGAYTPPSGAGLAPAARKAADALEYFSLQAQYYGTSVKKYTNDLKQSIVSQTLQLAQKTPQDINQFKTRVSQLRSTLQIPDGDTDRQEKLTDARDEIADLLKNITGEYDNSKIDAVVQELESNLDQTGLSFGEAINSSKLLAKLFNDATSIGGQYTRVLKEFSEATGVAVEELEKLASLEDVKQAESNKKLIESTNKLSGYLAKAGLSIAAFGGIISSTIDAPDNRASRSASAAIGGSTQTAGSLLAFGSNILSTTAATAAMTGGGGLAKAASSLMPLLTNPITLAVGGVVVALGALGSGLKDASNAARDFDMKRLSDNVEKSLVKVSDYFKDFANDLKNLNLLSSIERELNVSINNALGSIKLRSQVPAVFWTNIIDALAIRDTASAERSSILQQQGVGAYLDTTTIGQSVGSVVGMTLNGLLLGIPDLVYAGVSSAVTGRNFNESSMFTDLGYTQDANRSRNIANQLAAPQLAVQNSQQLQPVAESLFRLFDERIRSGTKSSDIMSGLGTSAAPSQFAETIARANPIVEEQILRLKASNVLTDLEKRARINSLIALEAEYKTRIRIDTALKEIEFKRLSQETKIFATSIQRMINAMSAAINRTVFEIEKMSVSAELSNKALSGSAQAGQVFIKGINVLQNSRAYSPEDRRLGFGQASEMFGPMSDIMLSLLNVSDRMEDVVLSTINRTIRETPGDTSPEKISGAIRANLNNALLDLNLPPDLSEKLSRQVQRAFAELRTGENRRLSFAELVEKVPQFAEAIDTAKVAQQEAIKALEFWQTRVNDYAKSMNQSLEYQLEANKSLRDVLSVRIKSENDLIQTLGIMINLIDQRTNIFSQTAALTGGVTEPVAIKDRIFELENVRQTQQNILGQEAQGGPENQEAVKRMTRNLNLTNLALRESYQALKNMAESGELASAALARINVLQQQNQAGQNLIEKTVTSNFLEMTRFNRSLSLLSNNMAGQTNPGSTPERRSEVLQAFSLIAPLLGEQQNVLKANVFESLLLESGAGINGLFRDVITSLRNPEADPVMSEAIGIYKQGVKLQIDANKSLSEIQTAMSLNTAEAAGKSLALALSAPDNLQAQLLQDIKTEIQSLVKLAGGNPAQNKALGGVVYAENGMFVNFQSKGTDTVPAMLTPGEFVVNRQATQNNLPLLKNINSGKTSYYSRGGLILPEAWASSSYLGNEKKIRDKALNESYSETTHKFLELKTPDITADPVIDREELYKSPNKYYAVTTSSTISKPINSSSQDSLTRTLGAIKENIVAAPGIAYDSFRFNMSMPGYKPVTEPSKAAQTGLGEFENIGKIPKVGSLADTIDDDGRSRKSIKEKDVKDYKRSYETIRESLKDSVSINEKVRNVPNEESLTNQLARATENLKSRISIAGGGGYVSQPIKVSNLSYDPGGGDNSLLFLDTPSIGVNVGNALGLRWNMNTSANIVGGLENMKGSHAAEFEKNILPFPQYQNGIVLNNLSRLSNLDLLLQQDLKKISDKNLEYTEEEQSATRKGFINKLESLYDQKVFSVSLGSEILKDRVDDGIKLPLTLYNMSKEKWNNYINNVETKQDLPDQAFSKNQWIKITDTDEDNNILGSREFPWTSKDFGEEERNITERFGKDFGEKPITFKNKTYGQIGKGKFYISYKDVTGRYFNEESGQFEGDKYSYSIIDPATQDNKFNPGSPLAEIIPKTKKLVWRNNGIKGLIKHLNDSTPEYDFENGTKKPSKNPEYRYNFSGVLDGGLPNKTPRLQKLLDNNQQYVDHPDIKDYILSRKNSSVLPTLNTFDLLSTEYKKSIEDRFEKSKTETTKKSAALVTGSNLFDLKTSLTEEDKLTGLDNKDLESFSSAKRVTLARYFYDKYANLSGLKGVAAPSSIQDMQKIISALDAQLPILSMSEGGVGGEKYNDVYALRNIFGTFLKPKDSDPGYLKRLGFSLKNKDFSNRVPAPLDPANPERTEIQYYQKYNSPNVQDLMNLLFNREKDYSRSVGNITSPNRTPFTDELKELLQTDTDGFSLTDIDTITGKITDAKDKQKINQWTDVEKVALNPYNMPAKSSARQRLLDSLYYFYSNDKDSQNKNIWQKERWENIGNSSLFGDRKILRSNDIRFEKPSTLIEWYSIQDNILNNTQQPEDRQSQLEELNKLGSNNFDALRSLDLQNKHKYLTGNLYGSLPDYKYLSSKLSLREEDKDIAGMKTGGMVYASNGKYIDFAPRGTDTVPAMLTPGEFVVNRAATQQHLPLLKAINKNTGGKISKINNGVVYASGGTLAEALPYAVNAINEAWVGTQSEDSSPVNLKKSMTYMLKAIGTAAVSPEFDKLIASMFKGGKYNKEDMIKNAHKFSKIDLGILTKILSSGGFLVSGLEEISKGIHYGEQSKDGKMFGSFGRGFSSFVKSIGEFQDVDFIKKIFGNNASAPIYGISSLISAADSLNYSPEQTGVTRGSGALYASVFDNPKAEMDFSSAVSETAKGAYNIHKLTGMPYPVSFIGSAVLQNIKQAEALSYQINDINKNSLNQRLNNTQAALNIGEQSDEYIPLDQPVSKIGITRDKMPGMLEFYENLGSLIFDTYTRDLSIREIGEKAIEAKRSLPIQFVDNHERFDLIDKKIKPSDRIDSAIDYSLMNTYYKQGFNNIWPSTLPTARGQSYSDSKAIRYKNLPNHYDFRQTVFDPTTQDIDNYISLYKQIIEHNNNLSKKRARLDTGKNSELFNFLGSEKTFDLSNIDDSPLISMASTIQENYIETKKATAMYSAQGAGAAALSIGKALEKYRSALDRQLLIRKKQTENTSNMATGGIVYASTGKYIDFAPKGTDVIPAMLTPGEFVVNREAAQQNLPLLKNMNSGGLIYRQRGSTNPERLSTMTVPTNSYSGLMTINQGSDGNYTSPSFDPSRRPLPKTKIDKARTEDLALKIKIIDEVLNSVESEAPTNTIYMGVGAGFSSTRKQKIYTPEQQQKIPILQSEKQELRKKLNFELLGTDGPDWSTRLELLFKQAAETAVGFTGGGVGTAIMSPSAAVTGPVGPAAGAASGYIGSVYAYRELMGKEYKDRLDILREAYPNQSMATDLAPMLLVASQAKNIIGGIKTAYTTGGIKTVGARAAGDFAGDVLGNTASALYTGQPYSPNALDALFSLSGVPPARRRKVTLPGDQTVPATARRSAENMQKSLSAEQLTHSHVSNKKPIDFSLLPTLIQKYAKLRKEVLLTTFGDMEGAKNQGVTDYDSFMRYIVENSDNIAKGINIGGTSPAGILLPSSINQALKTGVDKKTLLDALGPQIFDDTRGRRKNARLVPTPGMDSGKFLNQIREKVSNFSSDKITDTDLSKIFASLENSWVTRAVGKDYIFDTRNSRSYTALTGSEKELLDTIGTRQGDKTYGDRASNREKVSGIRSSDRIENAAYEKIEGEWIKTQATQPRRVVAKNESNSVAESAIYKKIKDFFRSKSKTLSKPPEVLYKDVLEASKSTGSGRLTPDTFQKTFFGLVNETPEAGIKTILSFAKMFGLNVQDIIPENFKLMVGQEQGVAGWWKEQTGDMFVGQNQQNNVVLHELVHSLVNRFGASAYGNLQSVLQEKMPEILKFMKKSKLLYRTYGEKDVSAGMYYVLRDLGLSKADRDTPEFDASSLMSGSLSIKEKINWQTAKSLPLEVNTDKGVVVPLDLTNAFDNPPGGPPPLQLNDVGKKYYGNVSKLTKAYSEPMTGSSEELDALRKMYIETYKSRHNYNNYTTLENAEMFKNIESVSGQVFDKYVGWGREEFLTQTVQSLPAMGYNGLDLFTEILSKGLANNGNKVFKKADLFARLGQYINEFREKYPVKEHKKVLIPDASSPIPPLIPAQQRAAGGLIYASSGSLVNFAPRGTDTVPAMLTPGEFVINRSSTSKHYDLLKSINEGSYYSHGDIVKRFNFGGYVKPSYYDRGRFVGSGTNNMGFDFSGFMQQLMGQLSRVVGLAIKEGMNRTQNIDNRSNGVSINIESQVLDRINDFTNRLRSVADTLVGLSSIPSDIKITAKHDINVIINGDTVLNRLNPEIQNIVMQELKKGFKNLIDNNSPVPSDKLINPFDIRPN